MKTYQVTDGITKQTFVAQSPEDAVWKFFSDYDWRDKPVDLKAEDCLGPDGTCTVYEILPRMLGEVSSLQVPLSAVRTEAMRRVLVNRARSDNLTDTEREVEQERLDTILKPKLTPDFLDTVLLAARTLGWLDCGDYTEIRGFVQALRSRAGLSGLNAEELEPFMYP